MIALLLSLVMAKPTQIDLSVNGVHRTAIVCLPIKSSTGKPPLFIFFHGFGGTAAKCQRVFQIENRWPNAIVVYPQGISAVLVGHKGIGWDIEGNERNRDVKFFDALRTKVVRDYHADPNRVFAGGFSNGGMFMYTLWSMRPDKVTAFCCTGACILSSDVQLRVPKPAFITISGNDNVVPTGYQERACQDALRVDGATAKGTQFGPAAEYHKGKRPVVVFRFNGGHSFSLKCLVPMIRFFNSVG